MTVSSAALGRLVLGGGALGSLTPTPISGTKIEYTPYFGSTKWIQEMSRFEVKLTDSAVSRYSMLEVIIANPLNVNDSKYSAFQYMRATHIASGKILFFGRIETATPSYDQELGQVLHVIARGMMRELANTLRMNDSFAAQTRSSITDTIVTNYPYTGLLTRSIEASGSTTTINRNWTNSNVDPLSAIEEIAIEDPWSDSTFAAVWLWDNSAGAWADNTAEAASAGGVAFNFLDTDDKRYFGLNNPWWGFDVDLAVNGSYSHITYEYWDGVEWNEFYLKTYYGWDKDYEPMFYAPDDWRSKSLTNGDPHAAAPPDGTSRYWIRCYATAVTTIATINQVIPFIGYGYDYFVDEDSVFRYFRRGLRPAGGAGYQYPYFTDAFGTAVAAPVNIADWKGENFYGAAENSTANINTTTAGKAYILADPDGTPAATGYWLRRIPVINTDYARIIIDANFTWGVATGTAVYGGLMLTKGTTYDANNQVKLVRTKTNVADKIEVSGTLNGVAIAGGNVVSADDALAFRIDKIGTTWYFYYSLTQSPGYVWVELAHEHDTNVYLSTDVSICLFAYANGAADTNSVQVDFDNFEVWDMNGLILEYEGESADNVAPIFEDHSIGDEPREIYTRVIVEGEDALGARVSSTVTDADLETTLNTIKEKKLSLRYATAADDCAQKAAALLELSKGAVSRGTVRIPDYPIYKTGGVYYPVRAGDSVQLELSPKGISSNYIVMEIAYEEPPGTSTLTLMERERGLLHSPFTLEERLNDLVVRVERAENIL